MYDNNFYSIDKLIDFGMSMAMAQQMIRVMNESMQTMYVPGSPNNIAQPQTPPIYVAIDGKPAGPFTDRELATLVSEQKISKDTLVWIPGMIEWKPLEQVPAALKIIAIVPPPLPTTNL